MYTTTYIIELVTPPHSLHWPSAITVSTWRCLRKPPGKFTISLGCASTDRRTVVAQGRALDDAIDGLQTSGRLVLGNTLLCADLLGDLLGDLLVNSRDFGTMMVGQWLIDGYLMVTTNYYLMVE